MSKHFHHKPRLFDFAETRAAKERDLSRRAASRRAARGLKESWLVEAIAARA